MNDAVSHDSVLRLLGKLMLRTHFLEEQIAALLQEKADKEAPQSPEQSSS